MYNNINKQYGDYKNNKSAKKISLILLNNLRPSWVNKSKIY